MRVGGKYSDRSIDFAEACTPLAAAPNDQWSALPPTHFPRTEGNFVILPDASVLFVGGSDESDVAPIHHTPVTTPELFKDGSWYELPAEASERSYHGVALLLPDGRVLSAGSEDRTWDYQIFQPHYLQTSFVRPKVVGMTADRGSAPAFFSVSKQAFILGYGQSLSVTVGAESGGNLPLGTTIDRAVLMAPGAITHHSDMHQRLVQVPFEPMDDAVNVYHMTTPADSKACPRGFYMMFVLTNQGVPSQAAWVQLL